MCKSILTSFITKDLKHQCLDESLGILALKLDCKLLVAGEFKIGMTLIYSKENAQTNALENVEIVVGIVSQVSLDVQ